MFSSLLRLIKGPRPLDDSLWKDRVSPVTFRRFRAEDLSQCLKLYALNEPGRFPAGVRQSYERSLLEQSSYFLVAESAGRIVATGGLSYFVRSDVAVLCFGLVNPAHHGNGIGTAMLLARLSLLKTTHPVYHVLIFAVKESLGFYRRFGFKSFQPWVDPQGMQQPSGILRIKPKEIMRCRALLKSLQVALPDDEQVIPLRTE